MTDDAEILVHVSAPSGGSDDARYRRQAQGFLSFDAGAKHSLTGNGREEDKKYRTRIEEYREGVRHIPPKNVNTTPAAVFLSKQVLLQEGPATSPIIHVKRTPAVQVARTPAIHAVRNGLLERPRTAPAIVHDSLAGPSLQRSKSDSWETPPSVVPDSQPSYSSLKRAFAAAVSSSMTEEHISSPTAKRRHLEHGEELEIQQAEALSGDRLHSTEDTSVQEQEALIVRQVPPASEPRSSQVLPLRSSQSSSRSLNSVQTSIPEQPVSPSADLQSQEEVLRYHIHPPPPPTAEADFRSHVTPSLRKITSQVPLSKFFNPLIQTREARVWERGCWRFCIPCDTPQELRSKFWKFLEEFVGKRRAGIVSIERVITRSPPPDTRTDTETQGSDDSTKGMTKEEVTVYCFGEVVGEIWLVLWLASDRKIAGWGSIWYDGAGDAIITMR